MDKTALSYWFPQLAASGLPVPKTKILRMPVAAQEDIWAAFDGKDGSDGGAAMKQFAAEVAAVAAEFGYPFFLRTDLTSGKHNWENTCFVPAAIDIPRHIFAIVEFSECADIIGLAWDTWVIRELLPTLPLGICPNYGNMPVCREFRFFVDDGKVRCWHPYWPKHALEDGGADLIVAIDYDKLCDMGDAAAGLYVLAEKAGRAVGGSWSIDILETRRGWYVTDMAEAHKSFHWEDCKKC
jgi:hypothetical protein